MRRSTIASILLTLTLTLPAFAGGGEKGDFEIGVFGGYGFPDNYGDGLLELDPDDDSLVGARLGWFVTPNWSLELSGQTFESTIRPSPNTDFTIDSLRLNALRNFRSGYKLRPFLTFGAGTEAAEVVGTLDEDEVGINLGGGLRWYFGHNFGLRLDHRFVLTDVGGTVDDRQTNLETTAGLLVSFGGAKPGDADGDGVNDRKDRCPDTPRGAMVDPRGCPLDGDNDGVYDGIDKCPTTAPGVPVDATGCDRDTDGDGVHDGIDKCPDTPRGATVDAAGCPGDADGDGVYNGLDKCPDTPKGASVDSSGCPKDSDGDGVYDGIDKCPRTPSGVQIDATGCPKDTDGDGVHDGPDKCPDTPRGTKVDAKGCPELFEEEKRTLVLEGVNFELNSDKLTPGAAGVLNRVAQTLKEWPELRVEVGGHTDSAGAAGYNQDLSRRRAESVRAYLISQGADASRMTARGYGEDQPVRDNATREGRAANRRVELKKLN